MVLLGLKCDGEKICLDNLGYLVYCFTFSLPKVCILETVGKYGKID